MTDLSDTLRRLHPALWATLLLTLLLGGGVLLLLAQPRPLIYDVGAADDNRFLTRFVAAEQGDGATFRRTARQSRLRLHGGGTHPAIVRLRMHRSAELAGADLTLRLHAAPHLDLVGTLPDAAGWRTHHMLLPADATATTLLHTRLLTLTVSRAAQLSPSAAGDIRMPLDTAALCPLSAAGVQWHRLLLRVAGLVGLLLLLALWAWRLTGVRWLAPLVLAVAGGAVLWLALHDPLLLAWGLPTLPWLLLAGSAALLLSVWQPTAPLLAAVPDLALARRTVLLLLAAIVLLAGGLRLYALDLLPYGLWRDEAEHGLIIVRMLDDPTYRPVYIAEGRVNMPAVGFYLMLPAVALEGLQPHALRLMPALAGTLTVIPLYGLLHALWRRTDVALLGALLLACASWHITLSRYGFPTVIEPLLLLCGLWLLIGLHTRRTAPTGGHWLVLHALAGALLGLASQMYHTGRLVPVLVLLVLLLLRGGNRTPPRRWLAGALACGAGMLLVLAPLLGYAVLQPAAINDRVGSVFLLGNALERGRAPLGELDAAIGRHLLMFHLHGDSNGRHHAPDAPLLDPLSGAALLLGVLLLGRHWRDWRSLLLLLGLGLGVLPSLLAVDSPHAMRSIGAVVWACGSAAIGLRVGLHALLHRLPALRMMPVAVRGGSVASVLLLILLLNTSTYFVRMPPDVRVWTSFYPIHTRIGEFVQQQPATAPTVYVPLGITDNAVFRYLTYQQPVATFNTDDTEPAISLSQPAHAGDLFVLSGYRYQQDAAALATLPDLTLAQVQVGPLLPDGQTPSFVVYEVIE